MTAKPRKRNVGTIHTVTPGSTITIQEPSSGRKPKPNVATVMVQEINPVGGFVIFLREHAIVGLAVGFAIATQVQALIKQLIASFVDPLYGLFFSQKLSDKTLTLHWHGRPQVFGWGAFAYTVLDLVFVLLVIYVILKLFKLDKLDLPEPKKKNPEPKKEDEETIHEVEELEESEGNEK